MDLGGPYEESCRTVAPTMPASSWSRHGSAQYQRMVCPALHGWKYRSRCSADRVHLHSASSSERTSRSSATSVLTVPS